MFWLCDNQNKELGTWPVHQFSSNFYQTFPTDFEDLSASKKGRYDQPLVCHQNRTGRTVRAHQSKPVYEQQSTYVDIHAALLLSPLALTLPPSGGMGYTTASKAVVERHARSNRVLGTR